MADVRCDTGTVGPSEMEHPSGLRETPLDAPREAVRFDDSRVIAFYLPQFHEVAENTLWWGDGFTEWTNVARARPNFDGHVQPKIPRELGHYDLSDVSVMAQQVALARRYGVHGFCFYHYWFSGRRILEKPVDQFIGSDIDFPFCLCWANENWTRAWDGADHEVLLRQNYEAGDALAFIRDLLPYLKDRRYIRVNGAPLLLVYRAKQIPDPAGWFQVWRSYAADNGIENLHISVVNLQDIDSAAEVGADALVEFPPHRFGGGQTAPRQPPVVINAQWRGGLLDYSRVIAQSANRPVSTETFYRAAMPGWDNTPRRQDNPTVVVGSSPVRFEQWLRFLRAQARIEQPERERRIIFVNAWNEWGEGCVLEPDQQFGLGFLESVYRSGIAGRGEHDKSTQEARQRLFASLNTPINAVFDETVPDDRISGGVPQSDWDSVRPPSYLALAVARSLNRWPRIKRAAAAVYRAIRGAR